MLKDLLRLVRETLDAIDKYFPQYALKDLEQKVEAMLSELTRQRGGS